MKSLLIVKLGALGDIVMASTMLPALRKAYPDAHISWMVGKSGAKVLELLTDCPELLIVDENKLFAGKIYERFSEIIRANRQLIGRHFDHVLMPYRSPFYRLLFLTAWKVKTSTFVSERYLKKGIWHPLAYIRMALSNNNVDEQYVVFPEVHPEVLHKDVPAVDVLLVPGGAKNVLADDTQRRWSLEKYKQTATTLLKAGFSVGLVGDANDHWVEPSFSELCVQNFIGKTDIATLFALLAHCKILVTHDTGIMHFKQLVGGKTIALFGPTVAQEKIQESEQVCVFMPKNISCSPCYDGKKYARCDVPQCMNAIAVDAVVKKALQWLSLSY